MIKKIISVITLLSATIGCIFAESYKIEDILPAAILKELDGKEVIRRSSYKADDVKFELIPNTPLALLTKNQWTANTKPVFVVESLYVINKNRLSANSKLKGRKGDDISIANASRICRSISKMEGMQYYSNSAKKYETLYEHIYSIKGPDDTTRVADPIEGNADGLVSYCMMDDNKFGECNYRLNYRQSENEVLTTFTNVAWIKYFIKAVEPENLKISLVIIDCGDKFLIYMPMQVKFPAVPLLEKHLNQSFTSRLEAICSWFVMQF
ncbi:MAG: hypothetical protein K6F69_06960 [Treponema sp.]|nr:hypothetical protein [Treponema sp.]